MNFQCEPLSPDLLSEIQPLALRHFQEIDHSGLPHKFNVDFYLRANKDGQLRVYTARDEQRELRGYASFFLGLHQHYDNSIQAIQDAIYLAPEARRGWDGIHFLRWCDEQLASEGIAMVRQFSPVGAGSLHVLLTRLGYEIDEAVYVRKLR